MTILNLKTVDTTGRQGFTLLEVMIAISVLAIGLVSVYRLHGQSIAMMNGNKFYTLAPLLANSKMAELEVTAIDDLTDDEGDFGEDFVGFQWRVTVTAAESELLEKLAPDLKQIDLSVTFNDDQFSYHIRKYRI